MVWPQPIRHRLCTLGISARLLPERYGEIRHIKACFTGAGIPGGHRPVKVWKIGQQAIIFQTYIGTRMVLGAATIDPL